MSTAIKATSRTLANLLQRELGADPDLGPFFSGAGVMRVYLDSPAEMTGTRAGLSVWLYRIARDDVTLNRPPERIAPTTVLSPPFPARLHYLVCPVVEVQGIDGPETEQVILCKALEVLHEHPRLSGVDLSADFVRRDLEIGVRFETLSIEELARIWDALETSYRTSVSYEVTVVDIRAPVPDTVGLPVKVPIEDPVLVVDPS